MNEDLHLEHIRREYSSRSLSRSELPAEPLPMVERWLHEAIESRVYEPTAMLVGTASASSSTPATRAARGDRSPPTHAWR